MCAVRGGLTASSGKFEWVIEGDRRRGGMFVSFYVLASDIQ